MHLEALAGKLFAALLRMTETHIVPCRVMHGESDGHNLPGTEQDAVSCAVQAAKRLPAGLLCLEAGC